MGIKQKLIGLSNYLKSLTPEQLTELNRTLLKGKKSVSHMSAADVKKQQENAAVQEALNNFERKTKDFRYN